MQTIEANQSIEKINRTKVSIAALEYQTDILVALDRMSLHWLVEVEPNLAQRFFERAERYNGMRNMETLIGDINCLTPRKFYNKDNPNNGQFAHNYKIGNEYSRVLYITLSKYDTKNSKIDYDLWAKNIMCVGIEHGADETSFEVLEVPGMMEHGRVRVRLWWD